MRKGSRRNYLKLDEHYKLQDSKSSTNIQPKKYKENHTSSRIKQISEKKKNLNSSLHKRDRDTQLQKTYKDKMIAPFALVMMQARRICSDSFKILKESSLNGEFYTQWKRLSEMKVVSASWFDD